MRIIAGQFGSRRLRALPGTDTRPTSDRLRETLFNVLTAGQEAALAGSVWLDLCAGTGAVGLEALSRGAEKVYFVEPARAAAGIIRANLRELGITTGFEIIERDAAHALRLLDSREVICDYCFLDPPYRLTELYEPALTFLGQSQVLRSGAIAIAEHDKRFDPGENFGVLQRSRQLRQGDTTLSFYRKQ